MPAIVPPMIIGHRGASALAPENTVAAFTQAIAAGAHGIEFDVRLSRDGAPVVIHDATLKRTGLIAGSVSNLSAADLETVDVGSWFNRKYPRLANINYTRETIPRLRRLFDVMAPTAAVLYLEMKSDGRDSEPLARAVVELINQYALRERIVVESFSLPSLETVKRCDARIRTAALFEPKRRPVSLVRKLRMISLARRCGADEIALHHSLLSRRLVEKARAHGLETVVWTVDHPRWIQRARSYGIKSLITNHPARMIEYLKVSRLD